MLVQRIPTESCYMQEIVNLKTNEILYQGSVLGAEEFKKHNSLKNVKYQNPFTKKTLLKLGYCKK